MIPLHASHGGPEPITVGLVVLLAVVALALVYVGVYGLWVRYRGGVA